MSSKTGIEWTDSTWSPIRARVRLDATAIALEKGYTSLVQIAERMAGRVGQHCEHVSPGCEHCYAETNNHRCLPGNGTGLPYDRRSRDLIKVFVDTKVLLEPLKWKPMLTPVGQGGSIQEVRPRPRRIFVENQSDLFGKWVTDEMLDRVFAVMALCPQHVFQVLTKRPERMLAYLGRFLTGAEWASHLSELVDEDDIPLFGEDVECGIANTINGVLADGYNVGWPMKNVWLGVSVENQAAADERIPLLLQTPAAVRFISAEPLLGPVDLEHCIVERQGGGDADDEIETWWKSALDGSDIWHSDDGAVSDGPDYGKLNWVICGGESGPGARPMNPDWARSLRDQCAAAGVSFFFKQWGEWAPTDFEISNTGFTIPGDGAMARVGKKAAGALLDGWEWKQFPDELTTEN